MRRYLMTVIVLATAGPALASSIEHVTANATAGGSVQSTSCRDCPALKDPAETRKSYIVPTLKAGTQTIQLREINGVRKLVRTESWLGGSPVVFINKAPADTANATLTAPEAGEKPGSGDGIDSAATTAAVAGMTRQPAPPATGGDTAAITPLDTSGFELRRN